MIDALTGPAAVWNTASLYVAMPSAQAEDTISAHHCAVLDREFAGNAINLQLG